MSEFAAATRLEPAGPAGSDGAQSWQWDVPDTWQQGRGAWGGLVSGALTQAIEATASAHEPGRTVRTLTAHMSAPVETGIHRIDVAPARSGSALSTWSASIIASDGSERARGVSILGTPRVPELKTDGWADEAMPSLPLPGDTPRVPVVPPLGPVFAQHLAFRVVSGMPFSSSTQASASGWIEFADQAPWTAASLLAVVDAWWPTAYVAIDGPRPMATVSFEAHLLVEPATVPEGEPLAFGSELIGVNEGFTTELRRLWTVDGRLAVVNLQSIAIIK